MDLRVAFVMFSVGVLVYSMPLRYMTINVGNAQIVDACWEDKLCNPEVASNIRDFISQWKPDVVLFAEMYAEAQLYTNFEGGPVLPDGYEGMCGRSIDRFTGLEVTYNASDSSHQHECIAWNSSRLSMIEGSDTSVYGRNDQYGQSECNYDFTAFKVSLILENAINISFITVHPDSQVEECRLYEIAEYWDTLAIDSNTIIGTDWNAGRSCYLNYICKDSVDQLQRPSNFRINYSVGQHWNLYNDTSEEPTAIYGDGIVNEWLDNDFSNFGDPCTSCGLFYGTESLVYGSAVGGYGGFPRADGGSGCDHRQVLVDMWITPDNALWI